MNAQLLNLVDLKTARLKTKIANTNAQILNQMEAISQGVLPHHVLRLNEVMLQSYRYTSI